MKYMRFASSTQGMVKAPSSANIISASGYPTLRFTSSFENSFMHLDWDTALASNPQSLGMISFNILSR